MDRTRSEILFVALNITTDNTVPWILIFAHYACLCLQIFHKYVKTQSEVQL